METLSKEQTGRAIYRRIISTLLLLFTLLALLSPNAAADGGNVVNAYIVPDPPFGGQTVLIYSQLADLTNVTDVQSQYCTVNPDTMEIGVCYFLPTEDLGNNIFVSEITKLFSGGTMMGYKIIVVYQNQTTEFYPEKDYIYYNYSGAVVIETEVEIPLELIIIESILAVLIIAFVAVLVFRRVKDIKKDSSKTIAVGIVALVIVAILYGTLSMGALSGTVEPIEDFSLIDIHGTPWNLSDHSDKVVVLDFMAISCPPCEKVRQSLVVAIEDFTEDEVEIISVAVGPDTDLELRGYQVERGVEWTIARDTVDLVNQFGVAQLPKVVVIDKDGYATFETSVDEGPSKFRSEIDAALEGTAKPISIAQLSIFATGAFMGIAVYFSPCSFPMLPGFISFYLSTETTAEKKKSVRTILSSGIIAGFGIVLVFLIIGLIALSLGEAVNLGDYLIYMGPTVAVILIILGALMLTNLQYHLLIRPFQKLRAKIFGEKTPGEEDQTGYYTKLFSYGVGYGAAATACTAPLFIAILLAALVAGSFVDGLVILLMFSITILLLMTSITLLLSVFGQESVQKLAAHTDTIKKISGVILVIVGTYLLYYYYTTFF
ncbi:MAG: cytochrome c biogenesis protein CcdA [Thermoplasmata archaeon]